MAADLKRIFASDNIVEVRAKAVELAEQLDKRADRAIECLENSLVGRVSRMEYTEKSGSKK